MSEPNTTPLQTEPESDYQPSFISTNRLRELIGGNPEIKTDRDKADFLQALKSRGHEIEGLNSKFDLGEAVASIPDSAKELGLSMLHLFTTNPLTTIKGLSQTALGALEKAVPGAQSHEQAFDILADSVTERYGSWERIKNTLEKDPVGFVADVSTLVTGVGGLAKGAATLGAKSAVLSTRTANVLTRTAETITRMGNLVDPVNIALKTGLKTASLLKGKLALRTIQRANEAIGLNKLIKKTEVNETMLEGLGVTGSDRVKLTAKLNTTRYGEELAKLGVTGTLEEMSGQLGQIGNRTKQVYDKLLETASQPRPAARLRIPPEIDAEIMARTRQLERRGATAAELSDDPLLKRLDKESQEAYSRGFQKPSAPTPPTFKTQAADKALDRLYALRGGVKTDFADLLKGADEKVLQNLGLTSPETYRITNKTLTKNIGERLTGLGIEPDDTLPNIAKKLGEAGDLSKETLDRALAGISAPYKTKLADKVLSSLKQLKGSVPFRNLAKSLQDEHNRVVQLLIKNENRGLTLSELNESKRLLDNMAGDKAFTQAGDIKTSLAGKNLGELYKELRTFIEKAAEKNGIENVRDLNNNTQFAQELRKIIEKKIKSGLPTPAVETPGKFTAVEFENFRQQLRDLKIRNKERGLTLSELNKVDDSIAKILSEGVGKSDKLDLEALQRNVREVIDFNAKKQGIRNLEALRQQKVFSEVSKSLIDSKIARGGDKAAKSKNLGRQVTQVISSELLYRSKPGKAYGLLKGAAGFFQTMRSPQFQRDLATAVQLLKDGDFKALEGGIKIGRTPTAIEKKLISKQKFYRSNRQSLEVIDNIVKNLSKAYPVLRGLRITGAAQAVLDEQGRIIMPETVIEGQLQP